MLILNFESFPVLQTERLILRQLSFNDAVEIYALRSDPQINEHLDRELSANIDDAIAFIEKIHKTIADKQGLYWVITLKGNDALIGTVCFWNFNLDNGTIEIGYELTPKYQGKGLMLEAVNQVIRFGFDRMEAKVITAFPSEKNRRSILLLGNLGFKIDNSLYVNVHGDVDDILAYTLKNN